MTHHRRLRLNPLTIAVLTALAGSMPAIASANPAPGAPIGSDSKVNTAVHRYDAALSTAMDAAGDYVVVWEGNTALGYDIFAQRYAADGSAKGSEITVNTPIVGEQRSAHVAMDAAGDFVVVWSSNDGVPSHHYHVLAQRYNADGSPAGSAFQVDTTALESEVDAKVAMDAAGDFAVTWTGQDSDGDGIYLQRFDSSGAAQGTETLVNTTTTSNQNAPDIAMDAVGDFVIAWSSYIQDKEGPGVFAQRFSASGSPAGDQFQADAAGAGIQDSPHVAMDAAGDFLIAWQNTTYTDGVHRTYGAFGQRYSADGNTQGEVFSIEPGVTKAAFAHLAMDAAGDFISAWSLYDAASRVWLAQAQRFAADGSPQGGVIQVSPPATDILGQDMLPTVSMDASGDAVVAWSWLSEYAPDGYNGIYAQRFAREGSLDLSAGLVLSPSDAVVEPGASLALTATVTNDTEALSLTGDDALDAALTAASSISASITLPATVTFVSASGAGWICGDPVKRVLTCAYGATLAAGEVSPGISVSLTAATAPAIMSFSSTVSGGQPDDNATNDAATAQDANTDDSAPVAKGGTLAVNHNTAKTGSVRSSDADKDKRTYSRVTAPAHGTVTIASTGSFTYTPAKNYSGKDSFTFRANDGTLKSDPATVSIIVTEHTPVATAASFSMNHNTTHTSTLKATDADTGDRPTFSRVTAPKHGTLTLLTNGTYSYKPVVNFKGKDSFTFHVNDGSKTSNTATVAITVQ